MNLESQARSLIDNAERDLRRLLAEAATSSDYDELDFVLRLSSRLGELSAEFRAKTGPAAPDISPASATAEVGSPVKGTLRVTTNTAKRSKQARRSRTKAYPKFYRDGTTLVKIGWSKSKRGEYEHRAPFGLVDTIARVVAEITRKIDCFTMDDVLEQLGSQTSEEHPSYQAYLAMAWFKATGVITAVGRRGYRANTSDVLRHVSQLRESLGRP